MESPQVPSQEAIEKAVAALHEEATSFLSKLVEADSQLHNERGVVDLMQAHFRDALHLDSVDRFAIKLDEIKDLPGFSPVDWSYDQPGKECVVGIHKPKGPVKGKSLILNGHVDVVPTGPEDMWTTGPYKPFVKDGRLYGRGSGDMKAGVVAYCFAFKALRDLGFVPAAPVYLQAVIEEECTGNGALACCARGYKADAAVIPEPFAASIISAQLGVMWLKIRVRGRPAHVLDTSAGVSGIEAAQFLYDAMRKLEVEWNSEEQRSAHPEYAAFKHPINFNLGVIQGGEWASSVATECTFEVRVGFWPGRKLEEVRKEIEDVLEKAAKHRNIPYTLHWRGFQAEGCLMDPKGEMMQRLGQAHKKVTKADPIYTPVTCTTDARFFELYYGIPATCYGPEATNIHGIDESVSLQSMLEVTQVLAVFIAEWCGLEPIQAQSQ